MAIYGDLSRIYDAFMDNMDYSSWAEYLLRMLAPYAQPGDAILDMGCGTGNISIPLARAGYRVIAADASEQMLMAAAENARAAGVRINFVQEDARNFDVGNRVKAITAACDVVNYLLDKQSVSSFFRCAKRALQPGAPLLFDISSRYYYEHMLGSNTYVSESDTSLYAMHTSYEPGLCTMDVTFFDMDDDGRYTRYEEQHMLAAHTSDFLTGCLSAAGFENIKAFGFLTKNPPAEKVDRIQFIAFA